MGQKMSDGMQIVVPMRVNGLYVRSADEICAIDSREHFENAPAQLLGIDLESDDQLYTKMKRGVYLHWVVPKAMRRGMHEAGKTVFPHICNRYHVMRVVKQTGVYKVKTFSVESDVVSDNGKVSILLDNQGKTSVAYLGRVVEYGAEHDSLKEESSLQRIDLTALGYGEPGFSGFFAKSENCLSFHDDLEGIEDETKVEALWYVVVGYYEGCGFEPFEGVSTKEQLDAVLQTLKWKLQEDVEEYIQPPEILTAGILSLDVDTGQRDDNREENTPHIRVSVGTNMAEALAAGSTFERDLLRLCGNRLNEELKEDAIVYGESDDHRNGFDIEESDEIYVFKQSGEITREQAAQLDVLNERMREYQRIGHLLLSARQDGYVLWYNYHYVMRNLIKDSGEKQKKYDCYLKGMSELDVKITAMCEQRSRLGEEIEAGCGQLGTDRLKRIKDEPYWSAKTPTIMVRSEAADGGQMRLRNYRYGFDSEKLFDEETEGGNFLLCRTRSELLRPKMGTSFTLTGSYPEAEKDFLQEACVIFEDSEDPVGVRPADEAVCREESQPQYVGLLWGADYEDCGENMGWKLAEDDFLPVKEAEPGEFLMVCAGDEREYVTDRCILTPHAETAVKAALKKYCEVHREERLRQRLCNMGHIDALSQTMGTFHEQLRGRKFTLQLPLFPAENIYYKGTDYVKFMELAKKVIEDQTALSVMRNCPFRAIRAGKLHLEEVKLIDTFSRVTKLETRQIQIAEALECDGEIVLPPRLLQPARVLVSLGDGGNFPGMYPVIGWLRYNHLNQSMIVFDDQGACLGTLKLIGGSVKLVDGSLYLSVQKKHMQQDTAGRLTDLMSVLELLQKHPQYFEQMLSVIGTRQEEMKDTVVTETDASVYIGRPLALIPATVMLEVKGEMIRDDSWCEGQESVSPLLTQTFPMRIGDRRYHSDGLVGFFMDGVFHQEVCEARDFLAGNQIQTKLNEKNEMILLMDIGLNTTVTTGILPKKEVKLESDSYHEIIQSLRCSFLLGPTLQPEDGRVLPMEASAGTGWILNGVQTVREYGKELQVYKACEGVLEMKEVKTYAGDQYN